MYAGPDSTMYHVKPHIQLWNPPRGTFSIRWCPRNNNLLRANTTFRIIRLKVVKKTYNKGCASDQGKRAKGSTQLLSWFRDSMLVSAGRLSSPFRWKYRFMEDQKFMCWCMSSCDTYLRPALNGEVGANLPCSQISSASALNFLLLGYVLRSILPLAKALGAFWVKHHSSLVLELP